MESEQQRHFIHFGNEDAQAQEVRPEDYIVGNLMDLGQIGYDSHADLL